MSSNTGIRRVIARDLAGLALVLLTIAAAYQFLTPAVYDAAARIKAENDTVEILNPAEPPSSPCRPKPFIVLLFAVSAGLSGGLALVFATRKGHDLKG